METSFEANINIGGRDKAAADKQLCEEASAWEEFQESIRWGERTVEEAELVYHGWLTRHHAEAGIAVSR